jgi:hypothetical protein
MASMREQLEDGTLPVEIVDMVLRSILRRKAEIEYGVVVSVADTNGEGNDNLTGIARLDGLWRKPWRRGVPRL